MAQAVRLSDLLKKGGVYRQLPGTLPKQALDSLVNMVPGVSSCCKQELLTAILEREELMPTAMGNGLALPHPRNPIIDNELEQFAALAFLQNDIDWGALDGKPVHSLLLIVCANAKTHLAALQQISFFCRDKTFCTLLKNRAPTEEILTFVEKTEQEWELG